MIERIQAYFKLAIDGFIKNWMVMLISGLIYGVVTVLTAGILGGVLYAGLFMMWMEWYRHNTKPEINDLSKYKDQFVPLTLAFLATGLPLFIVCGLFHFMTGLVNLVVCLLLFVPCTIAGALLIWTIPMLVEGRHDAFWEAMIESKDFVLDKERSGGLVNHILVFAASFLAMFLVMLILGHIPVIGNIAGFAVAPIFFGVMAAYYMDITEGLKGLPETSAPAPKEPKKP